MHVDTTLHLPALDDQERPPTAWNSFLGFPGWSILAYLVSAAACCVGAIQVIVPLYDADDQGPGLIAIVATLVLYVWACVGAAQVVRRLPDGDRDVAPLVVLVALFSAAAGAALDSWSLTWPRLAFAAGLIQVAALVIALGPALRGIIGRLPLPWLASLLVLIAWNGMQAGIFGLAAQADGIGGGSVSQAFDAGWWIVVVATMVPALWQLERPRGEWAKDQTGLTPGSAHMGRLVWLALAVGTWGHLLLGHIMQLHGLRSATELLSAVPMLVAMALIAWRAWGPVPRFIQGLAVLSLLGTGGLLRGSAEPTTVLADPTLAMMAGAILLAWVAWRGRLPVVAIGLGIGAAIKAASMIPDPVVLIRSHGPWLLICSAFALLVIGVLCTAWRGRRQAA